jgi:hypothetical protein
MDGLLGDGVRWSRNDQGVAKLQPFDDVQGDGSSSKDQGSEPPVQLLRIIGALLLGVNVCATLYLRRLSRLRREQREREAARKKEELGGLVTEEGLDRVLDTGKRESMVLYEESLERLARHGGGGFSKLLLLQDKACVLPGTYNLQN